MPHPEQQYLDLMRELLDSGDRQVDAGHGKATIGAFGRQIRFDLSNGFPLLTTKKVYWNGVLQELYWFMSGQINIKHEKVSLQLYQRSADIFLGVPFNIASYALLCHIVARILGREVGEFVHTFGDVHFYEDHEAAIRQQLEREPKAFPIVKINDAVTSLDTFRPEHVELLGYDPHPPIKAELTVAGFRNLENRPD